MTAVRVKAGNQLSQDAQVLDMGTGYSLSEADGHVTVSNGGSRSFVATKPSGLGWDETNFGFGVTDIADILGTPRSVAMIDKTPEDFFDAFSDARSTPTTTYYVNISTGSDSNNGTTPGTAVKSIWKAISLANATSSPATIYVAAGTYPRGNQPWASGTLPTVDIALIATGGRVVTGTFDQFSAPSRDGTQTNTYKITVSNVQAVYDTLNRNAFGNYTELVNVSSAALCNATPNSWYCDGTSLYVNRADQRAVTNANTRLYRPQTGCLIVTSPINLYIGGQNPGDGFDMEGNSDTGGGTLGVLVGTPDSTNRALIVKNSTFKYPGGFTDTTNNSVSVNSWNGLAAFFNCRADGARNDGFNFHNSNSAAGMYVLTVNCTGYDNGRSPNASDNGWTTHDDVVGIDLCGYYEGNHGGTVRSINTSKSWLLRTTVKDDFGDRAFSGSTVPTAFEVNDTAVYWCERTRVLMAAGGYAYVAADSGTAIHQRSVDPSGLSNVATGTIDTF